MGVTGWEVICPSCQQALLERSAMSAGGQWTIGILHLRQILGRSNRKRIWNLETRKFVIFHLWQVIQILLEVSACFLNAYFLSKPPLWPSETSSPRRIDAAVDGDGRCEHEAMNVMLDCLIQNLHLVWEKRLLLWDKGSIPEKSTAENLVQRTSWSQKINIWGIWYMIQVHMSYIIEHIITYLFCFSHLHISTCLVLLITPWAARVPKHTWPSSFAKCLVPGCLSIKLHHPTCPTPSSFKLQIQRDWFDSCRSGWNEKDLTAKKKNTIPQSQWSKTISVSVCFTFLVVGLFLKNPPNLQPHKLQDGRRTAPHIAERFDPTAPHPGCRLVRKKPGSVGSGMELSS